MISSLYKTQPYLLALLLSLGVSSCQSPEQKAALAKQKLAEAQKQAADAEASVSAKQVGQQNTEREEKFKQFVESTPDLYKVTWKVCGDGMISIYKDINLGCSESRDIPTKGVLNPAFVWGPVGEVKFISKQSFIRSKQDTGLFVKSRGCLKSGNPKEQQFYNIEEFSLKKDNNPQPTNARIEIVPKHQKEKILRDAVANAEIENASLTNFGVSSNGLIPASKACKTIEEWKKASY